MSRTVSTHAPFTALKLHKSIPLHSSKFILQMNMQNEGEASPRWHPSHEKEKFPTRDSLFPKKTSNNYFSSNLSSYSSRAEGMASIQNQHVYRGYTPTKDFNSSLGASALDSQKLLNSDKEYHAYKSTFSSDREDLHLGGSSRVSPHANGYKLKTRLYDWSRIR